MKVKDFPEADRPREKLLQRGPQALTDSELIAILLRTGTTRLSVIEMAREIVKQNKNLAFLANRGVNELCKIHGIGKDKAATLLAAFELGKRIAEQLPVEIDVQVTSPADVARVFIPRLKHEVQEVFYVVCLSAMNKIVHKQEVTRGSLDSSIVHPREVFKIAVLNNAKSIILIHNHPSGNPEPSREDIQITRQLAEAGRLMEIQVVDHLIIAGNGFTSFAEKRLL